MQFLATGNLRSGAGGATALILRGSNTGANTLAQVINDQGGVTSLTKNDAGTWVLTGASTFSVVSLVGGALQVNAAETPAPAGLWASAARFTSWAALCGTAPQIPRITLLGFAPPTTSSAGLTATARVSASRRP